MIEHIFLLISFAIFGILGTMHLYYTFFSRKFHSDQSVMDAMNQASPKISTQTTMWKAWIGFNGSHSIGVMFFALINFYLVLESPGIYSESILIHIINMLFILSFLILAKFFWFKVPLNGIKLAFTFYIIALLIVNYK